MTDRVYSTQVLAAAWKKLTFGECSATGTLKLTNIGRLKWLAKNMDLGLPDNVQRGAEYLCHALHKYAVRRRELHTFFAQNC